MPSAPAFTSEHICVRDLYTRAMAFEGQDEFRWDWRVSGPTKDGAVSQPFERVRGPR